MRASPSNRKMAAAPAPGLRAALESVLQAAGSLDQAQHAELSELLLTTAADFMAANDGQGPTGRKAPRDDQGGEYKLVRGCSLVDKKGQGREEPRAGRILADREALTLVLRFLDAPALCRCARVCAAWRTAAHDERLWMWLFRKSEFPWPSVMTTSWRKDYIAHEVLERNWRSGHCTVRRLTGHRDGINCLCVSNDLVVTGSDDHDLRVWDVHASDPKTSAASHVLSQHQGKVVCCRMVRGVLVSGADDRSVCMWDIKSCTLIIELKVHQSAVLCMAADTRQFAYTGAVDHDICKWCTQTHACVGIFSGHRGPVLCLAVVPASGYLVSGSRDRDVRIWEPRTASSPPLSGGKSGGGGGDNDDSFASSMGSERGSERISGGRISCLFTLTGHEAAVTCLDAAGATIVSGSDDRSARFWNATTGTLLRTFGVHDGPLADVRIHGSLVATGSFDGRVRVFDCVSGRCLRVMSGHRNAVMCLAARARVLVSGSNDRDLRVFQLPDPSEPDTLPLLDAGQGATPLRAGLTSATDSPKTWRRGRETPAGGANLSSFSGGNPPPSAGGTASHDSLASSGFSAAVATSLGNLAGSSSSVPLGGGEDAEGGEGGGQGGEGGQSLQRLPLPQTGYALKGHHSGVRAVALAGERLLLSVSDDYELRVWDFSAVPSGGSRS